MRNEITLILKEIAELLELKGENHFKTRAYSNAAALISDDNIDIERHVREGTLREINGIGPALQEKLTQFVETGKMDYYEKLKAEIPQEMIDISKIKGVGAKKAKSLVEKYNVKSVDELEEMAKNGQLEALKGYGAKSAQLILESINENKQYENKFRLDKAYKAGKYILELLQNTGAVKKASSAGQLRRWLEVIDNIDFVVITEDLELLKSELQKEFSITVNSDTITFNYDKIPITLHFADEDNFGVVSHNLSCSDEYLSVFKDVAKNTFTLKDDKIYDGDKQISISSEQELYEKLTMQYVEPENREDAQALQYAITSGLPKLIEESDMKGMLHCHSTWSDGLNSIEEMALESKRLGYSYFAICDHSKTAVYANGLSEERVLAQHREIDELNSRDLGIKILKGIESDILNDGSLDYDEEILKKFDLVVASVHSNFTMSKSDMTDRVIRAVMSPYTTILGHPTGRLLLKRKGYEIDQHAVIDAAAEYKTIIEINANPHRLDLDWRLLGYAKQKGVKIAINPDAHNLRGLQHVMYGIRMARKGWLTHNDVVNTYSYTKFRMNCLSK
ncbi:MAG: DNA polymerase/3'-5' exonuclease PolX [Candidatus Kapaibacterium sp.]